METENCSLSIIYKPAENIEHKSYYIYTYVYIYVIRQTNPTKYDSKKTYIHQSQCKTL